MSEFLNGYLECMLWLAKDEDGNPLDSITADDIAPDALATITAECDDFANANRETWERGGWNDAQAGHDFFLTRNGHGAGFWDRRYNDDTRTCGKILTDNCRPYGEQDLYRGDDGKYYV